MKIQALLKRCATTAARPVLLSGLLLAGGAAGASTNNFLINGDFNGGSTGWTTWSWYSESWGSAWANFEIPASLDPASGSYKPGLVGVYDGTTELTVGANGGGGAGAFQILAASPGVEYTLTVQSGADAWWLPTGEIRLIWLDATNGEISRDVVTTTDSIHNDTNGGQGDLYDTGVPYQNFTNIATAPVGTKFLKVELADPVGIGSVFFDNAYLTAPIDPPAIANLYPDGTRLLQATNQFTFTVTSSAPIENSGVQLTLNGTDVSAALVIAGAGTTNLSVSYPGLQTNRTYSAVIAVTDTANLTTIKNATFDTFAPTFLWEAEDYDFNSGQFENSPVLSAVPVAGSYYGVYGTPGVDFYDHDGSGDHTYRAADGMATSVTGDVARQNFVDAGVADYNLGWFDGSGFPGGNNVGIGSYQPQEWVNYTRTFPAGTYNLYARISSGNGPTATVNVSQVTGGQGTSDQTTARLGAFRFPANGWGSYAYVPMTDRFGNPVSVTLSGTETLRISAGSGANVNFLMLVPPDTETPTITGVYPDGSTLVQGTNQLTFTVGSANHSIAQSNVVVTLNGVTNQSLAFTGSAGSWHVGVPLALNVTNYTAVIRVTDDAGNTHAVTLSFDTLDPNSYDIEAEDWDFNGGQFIDNPIITSAADPGSYFEQVGVDNVDSYVGDVAPPTTADFRYRSLDAIATSVCNDTLTRAVVAAQTTNSLAFNYNVGWWATNAWLNYTHTYPTGDFNVYARVAGGTGLTNQIQLDEVNGLNTTYLGTFTEVGRGYNAFDWVPLLNTNNGQMAKLTLGGVATLRTTTITGNVNPNSYLLVPAVVSAEPLQWSLSSGALTLRWNNSAFHLQVQTNAPGAGISASWSDYPNGGSSPVVIPVDSVQGAVFFRLSN